jgi:hypothetical protein
MQRLDATNQRIDGALQEVRACESTNRCDKSAVVEEPALQVRSSEQIYESLLPLNGSTHRVHEMQAQAFRDSRSRRRNCERYVKNLKSPENHNI